MNTNKKVRMGAKIFSIIFVLLMLIPLLYSAIYNVTNFIEKEVVKPKIEEKK